VYEVYVIHTGIFFRLGRDDGAALIVIPVVIRTTETCCGWFRTACASGGRARRASMEGDLLW